MMMLTEALKGAYLYKVATKNLSVDCEARKKAPKYWTNQMYIPLKIK